MWLWLWLAVLVTFSDEPELQRKQPRPGTWRGDVVGTHQRCPAGFGITRWQGHAGKNDVSVIPAPRGGVSTRRPPARRSQTGRRSRSAYLYVMPFVVLFGIFGLYPMVYSVVLSFENYSPGQPATWAGLANFTRALNDPTVWLAFRNVLLLLGVVVPCQLVFGFLIASFMHAKIRQRTGLLSGIYYLPVVANVIAVSLLFQLLFQQDGLVNYVLTRIGISPVSWLISPNSAHVTTMLLIFWRGVGWYIVFLLAGLRGLDPTYQEAGKVDGANAFQRAVHITIPQLRPIITFLLVLGLISGWQIFTEPALLFGGSGSMGGPSNAVLTPAIYIYEQGFTSLDYSYAAALSVLLALVTVTVSLVVLRIGRRAS